MPTDREKRRVAYECLRGYLEARERAPEAAPPQNFEEYCLLHFGEGFSKHFMIPYNQKLWGVHPREITAAWCSRFVPLPKLDDVLAGAVGLNDRELGYNQRFLYPRRGIGELTEALTAALQCPLHLQHAPQTIDWRARKLLFADGEVPYRALISTMPLDVLVASLRDAPAEVVAAGKRLMCTSLWYLDVALDVPCGQDLHWAYVPEPRYPFYRVGCYSNFSAALAPEGKASLYVELASREAPDLARLMPEVSAGLIDMKIIAKPEDIAFVEARRIDHAYVIFNHDYYAALEVLRPFLQDNGILSCGRYGTWTYSSMEDALVEGREAATQARALAS